MLSFAKFDSSHSQIFENPAWLNEHFDRDSSLKLDVSDAERKEQN